MKRTTEKEGRRHNTRFASVELTWKLGPDIYRDRASIQV